MIFLGLLIIFCLSPRPVNAQIPLFYQLLQAYRPAQQLQIATPTPIPQILGVTTTTSSKTTPVVPENVGGDGQITTIAVLGDSMIDTLKPGLPQLEKSLRLYYPNKKFNLLNYGYGSRDIEYGLYRLTNNYDYLGIHFESLISQNPDIIVVESFAYNNFGNTEAGINRHWLNLGALTTTIKQKLPHTKIVLATTITPNSVTFGNGIPDVHFSSMEKIEKTSTIKLYLQNTVNFATSQGFMLADAYHLSLFGNEGLRELINPTDNIHPSIAGSALFCDVVADTIYKNKLID